VIKSKHRRPPDPQSFVSSGFDNPVAIYSWQLQAIFVKPAGNRLQLHASAHIFLELLDIHCRHSHYQLPKPMSRTKAILYAIGSPLSLVAMVFLPVGRIDWIPGWIFIAVLVAIFGLSALLLARVNPVICRARSRFQPGAKKWDLILLAVLLPAMIVEIPVATFDAGRMGWSYVPQWIVIVG
jgi:hypothetical protein